MGESDRGILREIVHISAKDGMQSNRESQPLFCLRMLQAELGEFGKELPVVFLFADDLVACHPDRQLMEVRLER